MDAFGAASYGSLVKRNPLQYPELEMKFRNTLLIIAAGSLLFGIGCS